MIHSMRKVVFVLAAMIVGISLAACQQTAEVVETPAPPDYGGELGPIAKAFIGVWNSGDYSQLDAIATENYQRIAPDQNADGLEAMKAFMTQARAAYSDFHITVDESSFSEDLCFLLWTVTGTYSGEGADETSGAEVNLTGISLLRFVDGRITHEIVHYDTATLLAQVGEAELPHTE